MSTPEMKNRKGRQQTRGQKVLVTVLFILFVCCLVLSMMIPNYRVKPYAFVVKQRAQLKSIETAIELFNSEFDDYPPSDAMDVDDMHYCGAMKLCEAVLGWDLLGYHPDSLFRNYGTDDKGRLLYPDADALSSEVYWANVRARKGPYIPLDNSNVYSLVDLFGDGNTEPLAPKLLVMCDVFRHLKLPSTGKKVGMPILYYKADTAKTAHDVDDPNNPDNIYNYKDNHALLALGVPGKPGVKHPMYEDPKIFYEMTKNDRSLTENKPHRADTFILLSAGPDGLYGTPDDIANFEFKWKRK